MATIAIQTNKANNTTTFTILPRLGQTPKQSFLVKTNNLSQATKMIRPLHLDRLPVFKNLFSSNIKVIPPTGTNKVNIKVEKILEGSLDKGRWLMGNDIGTGSVTVCLLRSENNLKETVSLIKFLYWTSDQKAIKLNNVAHIQVNI